MGFIIRVCLASRGKGDLVDAALLEDVQDRLDLLHRSGFGIWGLGFGVWGLGFGV